MKVKRRFSSKKKIFILVFIIAVVLTFMTSATGRKLCCSGELRSYSSPDGHYRIAVYVYPDPFFVVGMPGSSGDRPGFVRLYNKENELLEEADIEMVQNVYESEIDWYKNRVHIKLVATWPLPQSEEN